MSEQPSSPIPTPVAARVSANGSSSHTRSGQRVFNSVSAGRYAGIIAACILAFTFSMLSFQAQRGAAMYRQASEAREPAARAALLRQSLEWNPRDPQAALTLSRLLPQVEGTALLLNALKYSPGNAALHWELVQRYMAGSDPGVALYWVRRSLQLDGYNAARRLAAVEGMLEMSRRGLAAGDRHKAADSAAAGLELLRQYILLADKERGKGPQHNDRGFGIRQEAEGMGLRLRTVLAIALHKPVKDGASGS